jgi:cholest-4-en-3-one 26-monooxygenase
MQPVDLLDPATYERGMPHEFFGWLREHDPVHWQEGRPGRGLLAGVPEPDQAGYWVISRHADLIEVSLDQQRFSSERRTSLVVDMPDDRIEQLRLWMINQDAPRHTKLRKLVNQGFTRRMIGNLSAHIQELAHEIVDGVARKGECDFVAAIAAELPLLVIAELMGCPATDRAKLFSWSNQLVGFEDPELSQGSNPSETMLEVFEYAGELARQRRADARDDLTSELVHAEVDGERLDDLTFNMFFLLLILAGNETTRNAISGGMLALSEHPDEKRKLLDDPSLLTTATEEMLRYVSPVISMRRTATCDTEIGGLPIRENDKIVMYYPSANRDGRVFERPDSFEVKRDPNPHLAFGWGPHFCLGANLARAEVRLLFSELLRRLPDIEVSEPPRRLRSATVNSIKSLQVRFTPES